MTCIESLYILIIKKNWLNTGGTPHIVVYMGKVTVIFSVKQFHLVPLIMVKEGDISVGKHIKPILFPLG